MANVKRPGGVVQFAGHQVNRMGFGAMQLAEVRRGAAADPDHARAILRAAVEFGVNHVDTAQFYGDGTANRLIKEALSPYPDELVLVSKVGAEHVNGSIAAAQRPEQLRAGIEANLSTLGIEVLPVVNLRRLDRAPGLRAEGDQRVDLDAQLAELMSLRDAGKIEGIGLSGVGVEQLRRALPAGIVCVQNAYSVIDRADEPLLGLCREHGIAWVPFFPLGSAFPNHAKVIEHPVVIEVAAELGATAAQVGLAWLLAEYNNTLLIPGTSNFRHLQQNLDAGGLSLTRGQLERLSAIAALQVS